MNQKKQVIKKIRKNQGSDKVPALRFPEFEDDWIEKKIQDEFYLISGQHLNPNEYTTEFAEELTPYFTGPSDFTNNQNELTKWSLKEGKVAKENDILFTVKGSGVGTSMLLTMKRVAMGRQLMALGSKSSSTAFIFPKLNSLKNYYIALASGNMIPGLSRDDILKTKLYFPSFTEQQKIAACLTVVDERIQGLQQKKAKLEEYKKGVMQKLFSQEIRFKIENEDGELVEPPDWEEKKLGEVFNSKKGTGLSKNVLDSRGQFNCILYGELYTTYAEVIFDVVSKTNDEGGTLSKQGDLLVPCSTTTSAIDLANVTALNEDNVRLGGDITILRARKNVNNTFYAYYLSNYKKLEIAKYGQGTTIVHLYYNHFKVMTIDLPSLEEQNKIARFLTSLDESIASVAKQIEATTTFKKGLLQQLFV